MGDFEIQLSLTNPLSTISQGDHFNCATSVVYLIETIIVTRLLENIFIWNIITCDIETYPIKSNYNVKNVSNKMMSDHLLVDSI